MEFFRGVVRALKYEIELQAVALDRGEKIIQQSMLGMKPKAKPARCVQGRIA
jgi:Asp-tRNA(Asn)/Glu-tRNA(Gln) amidotransferase B subunit